MSTLTPEQQKMLRGRGGWATLRMLAFPDDTANPDYGGSSHPRGFDEEHAWLEYDSKGIRVEVRGCTCGDWRNHAEDCRRTRRILAQATWAAVRAYARALPYELIADMQRCARRSQRLVNAEFNARYKDGKCHQPRPVSEDLNERFREARRLIDAEEKRLLDRAFPLADAEPEPDLLDLLA